MSQSFFGPQHAMACSHLYLALVCNMPSRPFELLNARWMTCFPRSDVLDLRLFPVPLNSDLWTSIPNLALFESLWVRWHNASRGQWSIRPICDPYWRGEPIASLSWNTWTGKKIVCFLAPFPCQRHFSSFEWRTSARLLRSKHLWVFL